MADVCCYRQQNERTLDPADRNVVQLRKDPNKRHRFNNFRPVILLKTELNIWIKVLAKKLALVVDTLVGETDM